MSISISGDGTFTGVSTNYSFDKSVSVGGTVTYEDVTNVDSIGIITGRNGMHITSGDVGIGIDTPTHKLHIVGTGNVQTKTSNGSAAIIYGINSDDEGLINLETPNDLTLHTNNTERLRITSDGNIGIGSTNPTVLLDVSGDLSANCKTVGTGGTTDTGKVVGYQEGNWTPKIAQTNDITQVATSYTNQVGKWVRIGNQVTVSFTLNMGASTGLSNTSQTLCIIDFPYKSIVRAGYYGSSSSIHANGWTVGQVVFVNILLGQNTTQTNGIYYARSDKNGTYADANYSSIGSGSLIGSITYLTDNTDWTPINGATII